MRDKMVIQFIIALQRPPPPMLMHDEEVLAAAAKIAVEIEAAMFRKYSIREEVTPDYGKRARTLLSNFRDDKNPQLRLDVLQGNLKPDKLVVCSAQDLASSEKKL